MTILAGLMREKGFYYFDRCFIVVGFHLSLARFVPLQICSVNTKHFFGSVFFPLAITNPLSVAKTIPILLRTGFESF